MAKARVRGGARPGSGRRAMYGEPLEAIVAVQFDAAQSKAIVAYANKHKINVSFLMREASLARAGAKALCVGFDADCSPSWAEARDMTKWPLKFTRKQHAAIEKAAAKHKITMRQYVLEATLAHIGRVDLGEAAALERRAAELKSMAAR